MNFSIAIARRPAPSSVNGLTSVNLGSADYDLLQQQHRNYISVLTSLGLGIIELEPLDAYPDAYFVEDVAIITPEIAVITRPGADSRRGETNHIKSALKKFRKLAYVHEPGTIDGGDVLVVRKHVIIGLSERTNEAGADQLCQILNEFKYHCDMIEVPEGLHLKSSINFVDSHTLLMTQACYGFDCLGSYRKLVVPETESYAANVVWINETLLIPSDHNATRRLLEENDYQTIAIPVSEVEKMDGGLTCLSLRLS